MRTFWLLSGTILLCAPVPASADAARDALAEIAKCADIATAPERLKCFDDATVGAKTALAAPPPAASPPVQQTSVQTEEKEEEGGLLSWFGLSRPVTKSEDFGKPPPPPKAESKEITEISASVLELAKNAYGRSVFILDNGQVWKQVDGDNTEVADPRRDEQMKITIETAVFGSYALRVEGRRGIVKVRRIK